MSDPLLPYYNRELAYFRRMAAEFARDNPKIAGRLKLGAEASQDPHVERLIEAFAFLNARIRHKLDDDFPEISDALLGILFPHYLAPIPSMSIVQFQLETEQAPTYELPARTQLETEPIHGEPCRFQTVYPVTLWPVELRQARLAGRPITAPRTRLSGRAESVLRLQLRSIVEEMPWSAMAPGSLRFYLHGASQYTYALYEALLNNALEIAVARTPQDPAAVILDRGCLQPVGFGADEGMLPYPSRSPLAYRLLTEYFVFPQKFLFLELSGLTADRLREFGHELEVFVYLNSQSLDLEQNVGPETFRLGCTPVVNLFRQRAEPIRVTHAQREYRIVPDARRPLSAEVYSIDEVVGANPAGEEFSFQPFFSHRHADRGEDFSCYWHAARRAPEPREEGDEGTEVYLSLVRTDFDPELLDEWYVDVETTCLNRDLPGRLPFGGGQPVLLLSGGEGPLSNIQMVTAPTPTRRPSRRRGAFWKLVSHLSLGHLALSDGEDGALALREMLKLYDFPDSVDTRPAFESLLSVESRRAVGRVSGGVCRGVEVEVEFRPDQFAENGLFLFSMVLERFLAHSCTINSFSQLSVRIRGREQPVRRWPPRSGERILL